MYHVGGENVENFSSIVNRKC